MSQRPNFLILHSDEHSFRCLSSRSKNRGGEPVNTPTLDGLIERGVHFDTACCQMPLCTPSRIAMLSGRHAHRCGAWGNNAILDPALPTFASQLGANGYATANVGKMHLGGNLQHAGFQA
ncbi:MAG: sulfatase-like hydrolase/transferase, partial [Myxococcota bacterium]